MKLPPITINAPALKGKHPHADSPLVRAVHALRQERQRVYKRACSVPETVRDLLASHPAVETVLAGNPPPLVPLRAQTLMELDDTPITAEEFVAMREAAGLTQRQMAHVLSCNVSHIGHMEHGRRIITPAMAALARMVCQTIVATEPL